MPIRPEKRYWDSSVIIAYLNEERGRADVCQSILDEAEHGKILIYTSALTITEVLKYRGAKPISKDKKDKVSGFFQNDYIRIVQVTRWIAFDAQDLVWDKDIPPKDALHVASALKSRVDLMETYDDDHLIKKSKTVGNPPLEIREPVHIQPGLKLVPTSRKGDENEKPKDQESENEKQSS
jgi:predicted nucleic acid-binding protein